MERIDITLIKYKGWVGFLWKRNKIIEKGWLKSWLWSKRIKKIIIEVRRLI
jgi:hypothetical protein